MSTSNNTKISRRDFLKVAGAEVAGLAAAGVLASQPGNALASDAVAANTWGVLIDLTRCTGCQSCAIACREANNLPECDQSPDQLDCTAYSFVDERQVITADGGRETVNVKRQCMHCQHPACVSACTVGALRKTAEGPVVYDSSKCIGCRYCQYACPFGVPTYDWNNPVGLIHKCQFCISRLEEGQLPACVSACPTGTLQFGRRDQLLARAHALIESHPGRYIDHIYGEHEAGGTSVLYMSYVPFDQLGFPTLGYEPIPRYAETIMKGTPVIAVTVATIASGLYWIMKRRELHQVQVSVPATDGENTP